ncbi:hypothetical protein E1B28_011077 [Marasmius oreades]|uniref:Uncharacterized protein n=1 Tax=Marasmius oreades TaxID=181124 RepID=A0A9P7UPK6_9AGAR|nr:uncharacterized protein E1B28_011077 [Marasmius oreades]KAG7089388.1 hypothetical protein E1B28_011077 [Marasmius oreades]
MPQPVNLTNENDEVWEEVPEDSEEEQFEPRRATSRAYSPRASTIKRRTAQRATFQRTQIRQAPRIERRHVHIPTEQWLDETLRLGKLAFVYLTDVIGGGIYLLRKPLSFLFFLWLLAFVLGHVSHQLKNAFRPLCIIPGISSSDLCKSNTQDTFRGKWADYAKLTDDQATTFEELLDASVGGSALSLEVKKVEMASKDLLTLVRFSKLTSRDLIAESLDRFIDDARSTGRGLQRLSSKIGGAVDSVMAVNNYALHTIEAAQSNSVSRSIRLLVPFMKPNTKEVVRQTFGEAMTVLSNTIQRLIVEAEVQLANLEKLEEDLLVLHELIHREDTSISSQKSEILSELWTKLGGNKARIEVFDKHLYLLKNLGVYRKQALAHVVAALQTLRALSDDMEDMRERVTAPELVGESVPVDVHLRSITIGLERLKESRVKAKEREDEAIRRVLQLDQAD